ncbi:hypothetical protein [uncultured Ilyobacter sp.]|uniref:hypothetical protein n=1 Tax=uncultured Ilyobacter sp. TaxID=544433 RepID=UPI002AA8D92C|nr:hypothetical protein [uncultured Ilyobacter sp.]
MNKNSFIEARSLKEISKHSLRIFFWSFPLSFVAITPLYMFHIDNFEILDLLKISSTVGMRASLFYIVIISIGCLFKWKINKSK